MPLQPRRGGYHPPATPKNINVNGALQYKFEYDKFGRTTANKVGNGTNWQTLSEMGYNAAGLLAKQTYGNGDTVEFSYDSLDRQTEKRYNGDDNQRVTYSYGNNGSVAQITDYFTNSNTRFTYDLAERVVSQREYSGTNKNGGELLSYTDFTYESKTNYLTGIKHFFPLGTQTIGYTYGNLKRGYMPDQVYGVSWNGANKLQNYYDDLGRLVRKSYNGNKDFGMVYTYEDITVNNDQRTTTLVNSVATPTGTLTYTYDKLGNILSVTDGTYTTSYEYDSLNQLTRVNDEKAGKTTTYSYTNGNITECNEYPVGDGVLDVPQTTKTWEYNDSTWGDLLTNFNGESITYDEIGNPLTIGEKSLTWTGRQLQSITDGDSEIAYTYNGDGLRTSKTVNGTKTEYYYNGSILAGQKSGDDTLVFMYDNNSDIFGFIYNDTEYYYIKNAQNDVIAIADANGEVLVKYTYDAWGKVISITDKDGNPIDDSVGVDAHIDPQNTDDTTVGNGVLDVPSTANEPTTADESVSSTTFDPQIAQIARINPILYRSYYYDKETEWYYLNTRYYSPDMCRFINADTITDGGAGLLGNNLFIYSANNPVNNSDETGQWIIKNAIKWVSKNVIRPAVKRIQKKLSNKKGTYSCGINVSGSPSAFSFNCQIGISVDTKGNAVFQRNLSGGVTTGEPCASVTLYQTITNVPTVRKLEGPGYQLGGSVGFPAGPIPLAAGGDFNILPEAESNKLYFGATTNVGLGTPGGEVHVEWGETTSLKENQFNVFDVAKGIYVKIMEW